LIIDALLSYSSEVLVVPDTGSLRGDLVELGVTLVRYGTSPLGEALARTMASTTDDEESSATRTEFWDARHDEIQTLVDRAKARGELPDFVESRQLIEVFISPIHFRLLLTREPIDQTFLHQLAGIAISGVSARPL